jgi:Zn-dependent protease with chaperone function
MMSYPPRAYQHEKDTESFINVKGISWLTSLSKRVMGEELEQDFYLLNLMDNVRMTEEDFPLIHSYVDEACEKLEFSVKPVLFLDTDAEPKTLCIGDKKPMLIISNSLVELLNPDELKAALAHELGHLACGHSFYKLIVENFSGITKTMSAIPGLAAFSFAARLPLYDWFRKADLSADRAALLTVGNPETIISMIGKLAGGSSDMAETVSEKNLIKQSEEIDTLTEEMKNGGAMDKISYLFSAAVMNGVMRRSPWPAMRIKEIREWSQSEEYGNALKGIFPAEIVPEKKEEDSSTLDKLKFWKGSDKKE